MGRITARRRVLRVRRDGTAAARADLLAVEEPLEVRVDGRPLSVTMRTPGDDLELCLGFLVAEGILAADSDVVSAAHSSGSAVDVRLAEHLPPLPEDLSRRVTTTSACGLCGKTSLAAVHTTSRFRTDTDPIRVDAQFLLDLPDRLRERQTAFDKTGGLHAAGLFDARTGELLTVREDVGRHNAVDKVVGWALTQQRLPLSGTVLQVSGRASYELVLKAAMAGIPVLSAVSAPSSMAAELAVDHGITLAGFTRGDSMVLYSREDRVLLEHSPARPPR
ncbi:formate dehydrogenase accessory sulfurtransferase FdhD [Gordonia phosphorivorans]|uniref:Sulfur carrier protein FdhD n=1 Tax=Gordonia phosphorivorans TaxID=1056982 RepID=A0ABV6H595_9ACTN